MAEAPLPHVVSNQVLHPEALKDAVRDARLEPCQLSSQPAPSTLRRLICPSVTLDFAHLGPSMLFTGTMSAGAYTIVFITDCPRAGYAFNFQLEHTADYLGFFPPRALVDAMTPEGYANATLSVPIPVFESLLRRFAVELPDAMLAAGAGMRVAPPERARLRAVLAGVESAMITAPESLVGADVRAGIERELLEVFSQALIAGCADLVGPPTVRTGNRLRRLRQARDFLRSQMHAPVYLEEVSREIGLTPRSVEALFQDFLGIQPTTFLRHHRLHAVRRTLRERGPGRGAIKSAALEAGFWHLGRFAQEYRSLFGELPSETVESLA